MSLILDGVDDSVFYNNDSDVQGVPTFAQLPHLQGTPTWLTFDLKTSATSGFMFSLGDTNSASRLWAGQFSGANLQLIGTGSGTAQKSFTLNQWQRILFYWGSKTQRLVTVEGVDGTTDATSVAWHLATNELNIGSLHYNSSPRALFVACKIANVAVGCAKLSPAARAANVNGVNPMSLPGCVRFWPLFNDYDDDLAATWTLLNVGTPAAFDTGDHPAVDAWPPAGGVPIFPFDSPAIHGVSI